MDDGATSGGNDGVGGGGLAAVGWSVGHGLRILPLVGESY